MKTRTSKSTRTGALFAGIVPLLSLSVSALPAYAQSEIVQVDIDAQPLAKALIEYAEQTDIVVMAPAGLVEGRATDGVEGVDDPELALDRLLDSTGLEYRFVDEDTVAISSGIASAEDSKSGNGEPTPSPVMMAQASRNQATTSPNSGQSNGATSIVSGRVVDARTGANLRGAKVTIEETGQWTSTGDLGRYRFANVPEGEYTLTVSFLGYAGQSTVIAVEEGLLVAENFALRGGSEIEEIVVFGQRSARALALNQERVAANFTTVLADDFLGQFEGDTVSEALRRAPGIAFTQDPVTGDGTNIIVRGLGPDFNTVTVNGVRLPEGTGLGRSPDLGNILTDSIAKITISKTLLPSQDGSGTGGLIDIETKGPLDRPMRFANLSVQGSQRESDFNEEFLVSGVLSGVFGEKENLGLSAAVQYRDQNIQSYSYNVFSNFGEYLPLDENGNPYTSSLFFDPLNVRFPYEPGVDNVYPRALAAGFDETQAETLSLTLSGQYQIGDHSTLRLDYIRSEQVIDNYNSLFSLDTFSGYVPLPIDELGGEVRGALVWENGVFGPGASLFIQQINGFSSREVDTDVFTFNGMTTQGRWSIEYGVGYTDGVSSTPINQSVDFSRVEGFLAQVDPLFLTDEARENTVAGNIVSPFAARVGSNFPRLLLNSNGFDFLNDPANYLLSGGGNTMTSGRNERRTAKLDVRYDFESEYFKYLKIGGFYERARFEDDGSTEFSFSSGTATLDSLGIEFREGLLSDIGVDNGFAIISQADFLAFINSIDRIAAENPDVTISPASGGVILRNQTFTEEDNLAAYIEGRVDIGRVEVVGGLRVESVDVSARTNVGPRIRLADGTRDIDAENRLRKLVDQKGEQTEVLPRVGLTYRHSNNLLLRASYFRAVARPQLANLNRVRQISLDLRPRNGPNRNQPQLGIFEGNPDLDPSFTDSYDVSVEYYFDDIGAIKLSVFHKSIDNLLERNRTTGVDVLDGNAIPDDPAFDNLPDDIIIVAQRPENSPFDAEIRGVELAAERQLTFLPGAWDGLGVFGNYTYTDSEQNLLTGYFDPSFNFEEVRVSAPFTDDPEHSGTVAVTYNKYGIDASVSYTWQDRRLSTYLPYGLSEYQEDDDSLDLRAEYRLEKPSGIWRIFFEASDVLSDAEDTDVELGVGGEGGTPEVFQSARYFGGRTLTLGLSYSFQ